MNSIQQRIEDLDLTLFSGISSQSSENDRRSLLACQLAVRKLAPGYAYLEIGSHLGGSIQPHLLDEQCAQIYSFDLRVPSQPDERGPEFAYPENSTARMLEGLGRLAPASMAKVVCVDGDSSNVPPEVVGHAPALSFIDGEHTDRAVRADYEFVSKVMARPGAILFHDAPVIYNALAAIVEDLGRQGRPFHAYHLPDVLFVVEIGDFPLHSSPAIHDLLVDNHTGYLGALRANDHYRRFANRGVFRALRRLRGLVSRRRRR